MTLEITERILTAIKMNIGIIVQFLYTDGILKWKNLTVYSLTGIAIMSVYEISSL